MDSFMKDYLDAFPSKVILPTLKLWHLIISFFWLDFNAISRRKRWAKIYSSVSSKTRMQTQEIRHTNSFGDEVDLTIFVPSEVCKMRADTFSTKEPEILDWIDKFGDNSGCFWDVGANIGLYSIYYAKNHGGKVVAFEPSVFNLSELVKNIKINSVSSLVTIIPNPLSSKTGIENFLLSGTDEGSAANAFGVDYGQDGGKLAAVSSYPVLGFSGSDFFSMGLVKQPPSVIKIDVDGIEHLILQGMEDVLSHPSCKSIFIEVNSEFYEQADLVSKYLIGSGFELASKEKSMLMKNSPSHNEIWHKL